MWWKMLIPVDISVVNALAQFARVDWGLPAWRIHPDAAILRIPQYQGNRLGQMMLIQLVLPRSETFEGTGDRAESWLAHRGGRQGDDERDYAERERVWTVVASEARSLIMFCQFLLILFSSFSVLLSKTTRGPSGR